MFLAEIIYFCHTCRVIAVSKPVYQSVGCIIITDCYHGWNITVDFISAVRLGKRVVAFIYSPHNVQFDQACCLHWSIIDHTFRIFQQVADIDRPCSIISWQQGLHLIQEIIHTGVSIVSEGGAGGRGKSSVLLFRFWRGFSWFWLCRRCFSCRCPDRAFLFS